MSLFDLSQRAEAIYKKYEKYDASNVQERGKSNDPFTDEYLDVEAEVEKLMEAAADIQLENSRSIIAQKNAEIRRAKQVLLTEAIDALQKKVKKGKGVTKQTIAERQEKVKEMVDRIYAIPDGMSTQARRPTRYNNKSKDGLGSKHNPIMLDVEGTSGKISANPLYYQHTEQTQQFDKEYEISKKRQDEQLDMIGQGVDRLGEIARNMNEELDRQNPIIDDIETAMDKVTGQLKTNNAKLKGLVQQMRSSRNFCVDVILICIILAIGAYIYSMFAKKG